MLTMYYQEFSGGGGCCQAIHAERRDYRRDGRSNGIAGAAAAEMMIFDLFGLRIGEDGLV
jgi:hypothetical protein